MLDLPYFLWNVNLDATSMTYNDACATSSGSEVGDEASSEATASCSCSSCHRLNLAEPHFDRAEIVSLPYVPGSGQARIH